MCDSPDGREERLSLSRTKNAPVNCLMSGVVAHSVVSLGPFILSALLNNHHQLQTLFPMCKHAHAQNVVKWTAGIMCKQSIK